MTGPWPLTGRSLQLEDLGRHYRDAGRAGVVLHGPAGVGKTRLAEEALRLAERSGRPIARAVGHPATSEIPLGALSHLLPVDLDTDLPPGEERTTLFHRARAELRRLAGDDRLVLLVDDLDLLDPTSVAVLVPLVLARTVFLVGTVRTGRTPSPQLGALERDGHLVRMEVGTLDADELGALLHRALDDPVSARALDALARLSGGNLQVLRELVRGALERGVLTNVGGVWDLTGPLPTTAALEELVAEHLAGVPPEGLEVLELLAECERLGLLDLEQRFGAATLDHLEQSGLLTVVADGRRTAARLAHPLYGEVLRARIPALRLRRLRAALADLVEAHGARRREDVLRVALWRVASGGAVAPDHLRRATGLALAGHDPALAIRLLTEGDASQLDPVERVELLVEAHSQRADVDDVERLVAEAERLPMADARRVLLAGRLANARFYQRRDLAGALAALTDLRPRLTDPVALAALDARRAGLLAGAGKPAMALAVMDGIDDPDAPPAGLELAGARGVALLSVGRFDEAIELARRAAEEQAALPGQLARRGIAQHVLTECHAYAYSGRYREARRLLEPAADRARATGALAASVWFEMALAEVARDTGRGREALERFRAVASAATQAGQEAALVWAHVGVAQGLLLLGRCDEGAVALQRADEEGDSPVATSWGTRERTRAWLHACRGDLQSARRVLREAVVPVREDGVRVFEVALLHDLVRFGVPAEAVDRLEELALVVEGPLAAANALHARALVARDVDRLRAAVDAYEAEDILHFGAEAAAELADLHRQRGEGRLATAAMQHAVQLAARAGGVRSAALQRGNGVEPLTAREREVALLAASGSSSRQIGDHLGMATRTVDTHLARVYRKLGIAGRSELAAALEHEVPAHRPA